MPYRDEITIVDYLLQEIILKESIMPQTVKKRSRSKIEIKERIMNIAGWDSNSLTELYLDELNLKKLREVYSITKAMRVSKKS